MLTTTLLNIEMELSLLCYLRNIDNALVMSNQWSRLFNVGQLCYGCNVGSRSHIVHLKDICISNIVQ